MIKKMTHNVQSNNESFAKPSHFNNPVCGVRVDRHSPKHIIEYNGEKVYFCCDGCKIKFEAEPARYMIKAHLFRFSIVRVYPPLHVIANCECNEAGSKEG